MKSQKGQALVELALVLPILLMLIFGIVDFGRIFHAYLTLDHAGREAARTASVGAEDSEIYATVTNSTVGLNDSNLNTKLSPSGERESGSEISVTLTYDIGFLTPVIQSLSSPITLKDTTVMRVE
ncbi:TadE/TadG family type IV pilus assembly protein [Halobacillus seohaensis]|uniref:TadE/TadG family type IV pilus assembly protein n=1 Tax=Halobacillus seohaensis TaxID=447421 RepID=A0ABW2ETT1_9BACI